jgi:hypothetical protein
MCIPLLIGVVLDKWCKIELPDGKIGYDYTIPMLIFTGIAVLSVFVSILLNREDARKGYGLEEANMKN